MFTHFLRLSELSQASDETVLVASLVFFLLHFCKKKFWCEDQELKCVHVCFHSQEVQEEVLQEYNRMKRVSVKSKLFKRPDGDHL